MTATETTVYAAPETRRAEVADVRYAQRRIDVLAVPYDVETDVFDDKHGEYRESFAPAAFHGLERRLSGRDRVTVNRDHDAARLVGKVMALHRSRKDGLVAELRMTADLPLADETLALAADDVLGASISFSPMPDGDEWSTNPLRRRVTRARLHHIALTPEPAYPDATVLAVRHAMGAPPPAGTPWLDAILAQRRLARYSRL